MNYLKSYKLFESIHISMNFDKLDESKDDDSDVMAFHQLYDSEFFIAFGYRELLIKNKSEISELIEKYNQTYISEEEWIGGPVNRKFDEYFIKKYKPILGDIPNLKISNPYKPSFYLVFKTEYGYLPCGFSLVSKKMNSLYSNTFSLEYSDKMDKDIVSIRYSKDKIEMSNYKDSYSNSVITQMNRFLNNYWNSEIDELLSELNIKIKFDWEWEK